ncbi:MAG: PEP-CTERM sorting domain-containing protein [Armatimonadetes bacterium]|nr:PEP-CTERM sorting domain-containing protein [Armatimonadota bacterium]
MKRTVLTLIIAAGMGTLAHASFDMMFVADGVTKSIHRIDPINGVSLGRFGAGFLSNPVSVSLGPNNEVWVLDQPGSNSRVRKFNGNTGDYLGGFSLYYSTGSDSKLRVVGNNVFVTSGNGFGSGYLFNYQLNGNLNGASYLSLTEAGNQTQGVAVIGSTVYCSSIQSAFSRHLFYQTPVSSSWNGGFIGYSNTVTSSANPGYLTAANGLLVHTAGVTQGFVFNSSLAFIQSFGISGFTSIKGLAGGHEDLVHVAGMTSNGFGVAKYYSGTNDFISPTVIGGTGITDPRDIAVLIAPEPGTMIALGAGLAALLRKRRRAS